MNGLATSARHVESFANPRRYLADLDADTVGGLVARACDIAIVLEDGIVRDVAVSGDELASEGYASAWRDQPWVDTVTVESRPKIEELLVDSTAADSAWRQVNHPARDQVDVPVQYTVFPTGGNRAVALGREMRTLSLLQQRLVDTHQSLERDYSRLREIETRYRLLFQGIEHPVLIVAPSELRILDANPAALALASGSATTAPGGTLTALFDDDAIERVSLGVADALAGRVVDLSDLPLRSGSSCDLSLAAFRDGSGSGLIVQLRLDEAARPDADEPLAQFGIEALETLPDAIVIASKDLRITFANRAFGELVQVVNTSHVLGAPLSDYLGRSSTDLNVLISALRSHGLARNFATVIRDRIGGAEPVEISAVASPVHRAARYAFSIRSMARNPRTTVAMDAAAAPQPHQISELVGRVSLKEIVRDSTDFIEQRCIETALQLTDGNRASAAEMLGLSRQSLYVKLKRFGIDEDRS